MYFAQDFLHPQEPDLPALEQYLEGQGFAYLDDFYSDDEGVEIDDSDDANGY
jgi:hypothetical protein